MDRQLEVFWNEILVGALTQTKGGTLSFAYDRDYIADNGAAISISMPISEQPFSSELTKAFFSGLLPDESPRKNLARFLGVSDKNSFALLEAIGGECAGALSLRPIDFQIEELKGEPEILDNKRLKEILELLKRRPMLAGVDGVRLSLAGAQDKIAVGLIDNKIAIMKGNTPTTHILKPMIEGIKDSVQNELFCMRLAKAMNIKVPNASIIYVDDIPCYLVERYDRQMVDGKIIRVHQEDFCQAMGNPPELKYEREGGPSVEGSIELLRQNSARPAADIIQFTNLLIFNFLIGNADAHGKNYSLIYNSKKPQLAPAYDLLCTEIYPDLAKKMAMKIGGKYEPDMVHLRHWQKIVPDTIVAKRNLEKSLIDNATAIIPKAHEVAASLIAENSNSIVFEQIISVIEKRAKHLKGTFGEIIRGQ